MFEIMERQDQFIGSRHFEDDENGRPLVPAQFPRTPHPIATSVRRHHSDTEHTHVGVICTHPAWPRMKEGARITALLLE